MTFRQFRTAALAATFLAGSTVLGFAGSGGTAGAKGSMTMGSGGASVSEQAGASAGGKSVRGKTSTSLRTGKRLKSSSMAHSAREFAPGQRKKALGKKSARDLAPGRMKKSGQSARSLAPGQQKPATTGAGSSRGSGGGGGY